MKFAIFIYPLRLLNLYVKARQHRSEVIEQFLSTPTSVYLM